MGASSLIAETALASKGSEEPCVFNSRLCCDVPSRMRNQPLRKVAPSVINVKQKLSDALVVLCQAILGNDR